MKGTAYLIQAALIFIWWTGLFASDSFFQIFQFPEIGRKAFFSFIGPDILIVALLSLVRAHYAKRDLELIILGGFAFATCYCINACYLTKGGYLPMTVMILGLFYNFFLVYSSQLFRVSSSTNVFINSFKTIVQIICVWTITLVLFPILILKSLGHEIVPMYNLSFYVGSSLFFLFSLLGLWSAYTMVTIGLGTPLPLDQTNILVTKGPYKIVRNPMAMAGIGQAISIALIYKSIPILVYVLLGALLWQVVVRPIEEKDMLSRFGKEYIAYKNSVSCWIPKFKR